MDDSSYESFTKEYRDRPLGKVHREDEPTLFLVFQPQEDRQAEDAGHPSLRACSSLSSKGIRVTMLGKASTFIHAEFNGNTPPIKLPEDYLAKLRRFIASLPEDGDQLPPLGYRVVVRAALGNQTVVRVYDRGNLPTPVIELIRLTDSRIEAAMPRFEPIRHWKKDALGLSAGESALIHLDCANQNLMTRPSRLIAESKDGSLIAVASISWISELRVYVAQSDLPIFRLTLPLGEKRSFHYTYIAFSADQSRLLVETDAPDLYEYNTKTWKRIFERLALPNGAISYVPSPDWKRGVAAYADGQAWIWDASMRRRIAPLVVDGKVEDVSFSPQGDLIALTSDAGKQFPKQITLWNARDGHLVRELWPVQWRAEIWGHLQWSGDGRLLTAGLHPFFGPRSIGVWDITDGRSLGTLAGCDPTEVFAEGDRLFQTCTSGDVLEWSANLLHEPTGQSRQLIRTPR